MLDEQKVAEEKQEELTHQQNRNANLRNKIKEMDVAKKVDEGRILKLKEETNDQRAEIARLKELLASTN